MIHLGADSRCSYRFDIRQFRRMSAAGIFDDQKVELVAGRIYPLTDLPPHVFAVEQLHEALRLLFPRDRWTIREEKPILINRFWVPKPDLSVLRGNRSDYAVRLPQPADVALLIEVADTTYHRDRGVKWRKYASAGVPVYIIVRLKGSDTVLEIWTEPTGKDQSAPYSNSVSYSARAAELAPVEIEGSCLGHIAVADLVAR
ncbi:MAG TPA: Uma2 family endonuclease [Isosphaeraceae bacterium]|nr:Uma2 family endonuclease [Isosphaeraceae bacterium]